LIEEIGVPLGSGTPDQRRDCVDDQSKVIFGFLDFVKGLLQRRLRGVLPGDVNMRTNQFNHITVATDDRMPHGMYVFYRTIRKSYSEINFEVYFLSDSLLCHFDHPLPVFGENAILEGLR
jgi:hypothetical protein